MKKFISIFILSISLQADISTTPFFFPLENLEPTYSLTSDKKFYRIENLQHFATDLNGIAFFLPNLITQAQIGYFSRINFTALDAYVSFTFPMDICFNNVEQYFSHNKVQPNSPKVWYLPYQDNLSIAISTTETSANKGKWVLFYPKVKQDYIYSLYNSSSQTYEFYSASLQHYNHMEGAYSYLFDKEKIDTFVQQLSYKAPKCQEPLTYLTPSSFDYYIKRIGGDINAITLLKKKNITLYSSSHFTSFKEMENYVQKIEATAKETGDSSLYSNFRIYANALSIIIKTTKKRQEETENLCYYINYTINTPLYKAQYLHPFTITNSCPQKKDLNDLIEYINRYIPGYDISGEFLVLDGINYIKTLQNEFYEFSSKDGCNIQQHPVKDNTIKNILSQLPSEGYFVNLHDWDNDADTRLDCLKIVNRKAYKLTSLTPELHFEPLPFSIIIKQQGNQGKFILFQKEINTEPQEQSSSSATFTSISFSPNSSRQNSFENQKTPTSLLPQNTIPTLEESRQSIPSINSASSSNSFSSTSSQSSNLEKQNRFSSESSSSTEKIASSSSDLLNIIVNKPLEPNGFFIHYTNPYNPTDPFSWIYITKKNNVYKLEGLKENGEFKWKNLNDMVTVEKIGNQFILRKK